MPKRNPRTGRFMKSGSGHRKTRRKSHKKRK
jgi:hypothetical protein